MEDKNDNVSANASVIYVEKSKIRLFRLTQAATITVTMSKMISLRQKGFTIVELLIVIATIAILASIVIVGYRSIQNRANDAAVQSDLEAISGIFEAYRVNPNNTNVFPQDLAALNSLSVKATKRSYKTTMNLNMVYCIDNTGSDAYQSYKLIAESKSGAIFVMTQDGFATHSLTEASFTASLCSNQSMALVSNGMYAPNNWQAWVLTG